MLQRNFYNHAAELSTELLVSITTTIICATTTIGSTSTGWWLHWNWSTGILLVNTTTITSTTSTTISSNSTGWLLQRAWSTGLLLLLLVLLLQ